MFNIDDVRIASANSTRRHDESLH